MGSKTSIRDNRAGQLFHDDLCRLKWDAYAKRAYRICLHRNEK